MARLTWVIGGSGFLGSRLVERLRKEGHEVVAIDPLADPRGDPRRAVAIAIDRAAVPRLQQLDRPSLVFHLGGSGSVSMAQADPLGDFSRTVESTTALLFALCDGSGPVPRLVFVSSAAVYGDATTMPIDEDAPLRPMSTYGLHKLLAEELVRSHGRIHGLTYAIVRFFSLYGPGLRKQLPWDACVRLSAGPTRFDGTGAEQRDWLHVDDAVALLLLVARAPEPALVVNGGSGIATRVDEALRLLADNLEGAGSFSFSGEQRQGDPRALVADLRLARSLGFAPRVPLADGLTEYTHWFSTLSR